MSCGMVQVGQGTELHTWSKIHLCTAWTLTWKDREGEIISHSTFSIVLPFNKRERIQKISNHAFETNIIFYVNYISILKKERSREGQISWKINLWPQHFLIKRENYSPNMLNKVAFLKGEKGKEKEKEQSWEMEEPCLLGFHS